MKKVLHVLSSNKYSGAENVVCTIIESFKNEYEMAYCSPTGPIKETLHNKGVTYFGLKKLTVAELKNIIEKYNPDIIQAHDVKASIICSFFSKKCKLISHIHFSGIGMNYKNLKSILYNFVSKKFSSVIWVSSSSYETYVYKEKIKNKSIILRNIIQPKETHKIDENFDLVFVGRMNKIKNPLRVVEIIRKIKEQYPDIRAVLIGDGEELDDVKIKVNECGLKNNVEIKGFINNPLDYVVNSKMMIMTSISEGTPMCALESMSLGVPIISTRTNGLIELIKEGKNGYLSDDDDEIVSIILKLITQKSKLDKLKKSTLVEFNKINDVEIYKEELRKLYQ